MNGGHYESTGLLEMIKWLVRMRSKWTAMTHDCFNTRRPSESLVIRIVLTVLGLKIEEGLMRWNTGWYCT